MERVSRLRRRTIPAKPQVRRECRRFGRCLRFEPLENRSLLTITLTGTILIANLPNSDGQPMPVRSAGIYTAFTTQDGSTTLWDGSTAEDGTFKAVCNAADPAKNDGILLFVDASPRAIVRPYVPPISVRQCDDLGSTKNQATWRIRAPFYTVENHSGTYTHNFILDAGATSPTRDAARALAIYSILKADYDFAKKLGGKLPSQIIAAFPNNTHLSGGRPVSYFSSPRVVNYTSDVLDRPDSVGHEFGHLFADANKFAERAGGDHDPRANMRGIERTDRAIPRDVTTADCQIAFGEGWAEYFTVAASRSAATNFHIPKLADTLSNEIPLNVDDGYGEDNEASVARILWHLDTGAKYGDATIAARSSAGVFAAVKGTHELSDLWDHLTAGQSPKDKAAMGALFAAMHVSPNVLPVNSGTRQLQFEVPQVRCRQTYEILGKPEYTYGWLAGSYIFAERYIRIYDATWKTLLLFDGPFKFEPGETLTGRFGTLTLPPAAAQSKANATYTINDVIWDAKFAGKTGFHWMVTGNKGQGELAAWQQPQPEPFPYWSAAGTLNPPQQANIFRADPAFGNVLQFGYDLWPGGAQYPTSIPSFTLSLYASPSGRFDDPAMSSNPLITYDITEPQYLTATSEADSHKTLNLPVDSTSIAAALVPYIGTDHYLVAKIHSNDDPLEERDFWVRFEGGMFQTYDGRIYVHGSASLDTETPEDLIPETVSLSDQGTGSVGVSWASQGTTISSTYSVSGSNGSVNVWLHGGDDILTVETGQQIPVYGFGGEGDDLLQDLDVAGVYQGGSSYAVYDANCFFDGGPGTDQLLGGTALANTTAGFGGDDTLRGDWADEVWGNYGNDHLVLDYSATDTPLESAGMYYGGDGTDSLLIKAPKGYVVNVDGFCVTVAGYPDVPYSGVESVKFDLGSGSTLLVAGATLTLDSAAVLSADVDIKVINGGTLDLNGASISANTVTLVDGSIINGTIAASSYIVQSGTISAHLGGSGGVTKTDDGSVTLSGTNTFTGDVTINQGLLFIDDDALPSGCTVLINDAGILEAHGAYPTAGGAGGWLASGAIDTNSTGTLALTGPESNLSLASYPDLYLGSIGSNTCSGTLTPGESGYLLGGGSGTLTVSSDLTNNGTTPRGVTVHGNVIFNSTSNAYTGDTVIDAGIAQFNYGCLPGTSIVINSAGVLKASGPWTTVADWLSNGAISTSSTGTITLTDDEPSITMGTYADLFLGAIGTVSYTGTLTPGTNGYLLGGGPGTLTVSSQLTGSNGVLTQGKVVLSNTSNNYTGDTEVIAGNLALGAAGVIPDGTGKGDLIVDAGAVFDLASHNETVNGLSGYGTVTNTVTTSGINTLTIGSGNASSTFDGAIQDGGSESVVGTVEVAKIGSGAVSLTGYDTYTGTTTISAGTLVVNSSSLPGDAEVATDAMLTFDEAGEGTYAGVISGDGVVVKDGDGRLTLAGENTYLGGTTVSAGTLVVSIASLLGNVAVAEDAGFVFDQDTDGEFSGEISGDGWVGKIGDGAVALTGGNTYTGGTYFQGGLLGVTALAKLGSGDLFFDGGGLRFDGAFDPSSRTMEFQGGVALFDVPASSTVTFASPVGDSGSGGLVKTGLGTLTLAAAATYDGDTSVQEGTLKLGTANAVPHGDGKGDLVVGADGVFDLAGYNQTVNGLWGDGMVTNNPAATASNTLTVGDGDVASTFDGIIQNGGGGGVTGTVAVVKTGGAMLAFTGANTYTGGTTISAGLMEFDAGAVPAGTNVITIGINGSLVATGAYPTAGGSGGWLASGKIAPASTGTLALVGDEGNISLSGYADLYLGAVGYVGYSGTLTPAGTTFRLGGGGGTLWVQSDLGNNGGATAASIRGAVILAGENTFTGGTTIVAGVAEFDAGAVPGEGTITVGSEGVLLATGEYATADEWLASGKINTASTGTLALVAGEGNLALGSYSGLYLGAMTDLTYTGTLTAAGTAYHLGGGGGTLTIASPLTDNGSATTVTVRGSVVLTSASNAYTGTTTVASGTLVANSDSLPGNVANGGSLVLSQDTDDTYTGVISGSGTVTKAGAGALTLSGANSYTGDTFIEGGILQFASGALPSTTITIHTAGTLAATGEYLTAGGPSGWLASQTIDPDSTGTLALVVSESNDIDMTGYAGLYLGAIGNVAYSSSYTITPAGSTYLLGGGGGTLTVESALTDDGATPRGVSVRGNVVLSSTSNDYTGLTTVEAGLLQVNAGALPDTTILLHGGTLAATGTYSTAGGSGGWLESGKLSADSWGTLALTGPESNLSMAGYPWLYLGAIGTVTCSGTLTPAGATYLLGGGPGTLTVSAQLTDNGAQTGVTVGGNVVLTNTSNDYSGDTTAEAGTLTLGAAGVIPDGAGHRNVTLSTGTTLDLAGFSETINGLLGEGRVINSGASGASLTIGVDNAATFEGTIEDGTSAVGLTKTGSGTLTLTGPNSYSGGTTISAGTLIASTESLPVDLITNDGTLVFNQADDGSFGSTGNLGQIDGTGSLVKAGPGVLTFPAGTDNDYQGATYLSGGPILAFSDEALGDGGDLVFRCGELRWGTDFDLGQYRDITLDTGCWGTLDTQDYDASIPGVISGDGGILKYGNGTLALNGTNTYQRGTTIYAGRVQCGTVSALGGRSTGGYNDLVMHGGRLDLNGQAGVLVDGLSGDGGLITDDSTGGGGVLDVDLADRGDVNYTFAGSFILGTQGKYGSLLIDVDSGVAGHPNSLTFTGAQLRFQGFLETSDTAVPGTIVVEQATGQAAPMMLAATMEIAGAGAVFEWNSPGMLTVNGGSLTIDQAVLDVQAGLAQVINGATVQIAGAEVEGQGVLRVSGGHVLVDDSPIYIGYHDTSTDSPGAVDVQAGRFEVTGDSDVVFGADGAEGLVTVAAGGVMQINGTGQIDMKPCQVDIAGTLATSRPLVFEATDTDADITLTFDGGTLQALDDATSTALIVFGTHANAHVYVAEDGMTIETNGYSVTIAQALEADPVQGGGLTKAGEGTLTLTGNSTYDGGTVVAAGTLTLNGSTGSILADSNLTFTGPGTFNYDNIGASGAISLTLGTLTFAEGEGRVLCTRTADEDSMLTFSQLAARPAGVVGVFAVAGTGAAPELNQVHFTSSPGTAGQFLDQGLFYDYQDDSSYAVWDSNGFLRPMDYSSTGDANCVQVSQGTSIGSGDADTHVETSVGISSQDSIQLRTLKISGAHDFELGTGETLTLSEGGLLKAGGNAATLSGGEGAAIDNYDVELVVRADAAGDDLTIATTITGDGALVKAGAGNVTLSGANDYSGGTVVDQGQLTIASVDALPVGEDLTIGAGTTVVLASGLGDEGSSGNRGEPGGGEGDDPTPAPDPQVMFLLQPVEGGTGDYTVSGDGVTTAYSVTIHSRPSSTATIQFELYVAIQGSDEDSANEGLQSARMMLDNSPGEGSGLVLSPVAQADGTGVALDANFVGQLGSFGGTIQDVTGDGTADIGGALPGGGTRAISVSVGLERLLQGLPAWADSSLSNGFSLVHVGTLSMSYDRWIAQGQTATLDARSCGQQLGPAGLVFTDSDKAEGMPSGMTMISAAGSNLVSELPVAVVVDLGSSGMAATGAPSVASNLLATTDNIDSGGLVVEQTAPSAGDLVSTQPAQAVSPSPAGDALATAPSPADAQAHDLAVALLALDPTWNGASTPDDQSATSGELSSALVDALLSGAGIG